MASKIGNKYKLKGTETRADILDKIGGAGGGAKKIYKKKAAGGTKAPEPRKRGGGVGMEPRVRTASGAIKKLSPKQSKRLSKADLADIKKTAKMPSKMKVTRSGKRPVVTGKDVGAAVVAGAAGGAYVAGRAVRKKKPTKLKKRTKSYMTRQFKDGTSEPYKVIKGSQFINQK